MPGMFTSRRIRSARSPRSLLERFVAGARFDDGVTLRTSSVVRITRRICGSSSTIRMRCGVHGLHGSKPKRSGLRSIGSVNENTEPWPRWLVRLIVPPCASTMAFAIGKPMPVPSTLIALILAAIKFLEDQILLGIVDARAAIRHAGNHEISAASAVIVIGSSAGEY